MGFERGDGAFPRKPARPTWWRVGLWRLRPARRPSSTSWSSSSTRRRSRPTGDDPRPVDGDDALVGAAVARLQQGQLAVPGPRPWPMRLNGDGTLLRILAECLLRSQRRRHVRSHQRSVLHPSARPSSANPPRDLGLYLKPASARGARTSTRGGTTATTSSTTGCGRSVTATRSLARSRSPELGGHAAGRGHDVRPGDAVSRREEPWSADLGNARLLTQARGRPHRVPGQLGLHRRSGRGVRERGDAARTGHQVQAGPGLPGPPRPPCSRWRSRRSRPACSPGRTSSSWCRSAEQTRRPRRRRSRRGGPALIASASRCRTARCPPPSIPATARSPSARSSPAYPGAVAYPADGFRLEWGLHLPPRPPRRHRARLAIGQDPAQHETIARRILVGEGRPPAAGLPVQARRRSQLRDGQHLPLQRLRQRVEERQRDADRHLSPTSGSTPSSPMNGSRPSSRWARWRTRRG